jgi:hypothetical protein
LVISDASAARWVRTGPVYGRDEGDRAAGKLSFSGRSGVVGVLARVGERGRHAQAALHRVVVAVQERLVGEVQPPGALLRELHIVRAERTPGGQDVEHRPIGHAEDRRGPGIEPGDRVALASKRLALGRATLVEQRVVRQVDLLGRGTRGGVVDERPQATRGLYEDAVHEGSLVSSPARRPHHRPGDPKWGRKA